MLGETPHGRAQESRRLGTVGAVRLAVAVLLALLLGAGPGLTIARLTLDADRPDLSGGGTLGGLPDGPVEVRAETVRLAAGFRSRTCTAG